jgi:adenylate cyclase
LSERSFVAELSRRNVFRAGALYAGATWALAQGIAQLGPSFGMPEWGTRWFVIACVVGFPFWLAFAWFYEFTPEGLKRESEVEPHESITHHTGRKLDFAIIGVLAIAVVLLVTDRFVLHHGVNEEAGVPVAEHSIAVLPFVNMSSDKEQEYFSDGISEELLNLLAKIPQLQVTARTSSFSFKGKDIKIPDIARTLHVAHVLEGSVRKSGNAVRITAQLIKAGTDTHLWSQTYDRKLDDIFAIQDEIAADVVKQLKVTLLGAAPKARTTDPEAYAMYLQAVQLGRQVTTEAFQQSDALYRKVLAIDPHYAPAWTGLSGNFSNEASQGLLSSKEGFAQARDAAMKALAIDPEYGAARASLGYIAMAGDNDLAGAAQHVERALALDPADPHVLGTSSTLLANLGRPDEALALGEAMVRRDPVNVSALYNLGNFQRAAGQLDAAIASFRTVLSLAPRRGVAHAQIGNALLLKGDAQGALAEIEQETSEVWKMIGLPLAYHALGRKADSDGALAALIAVAEKDGPYNIAYVYAYRGEADKAFEWLDKAVEYGDGGLGEIVTETLFDKIRADPRWLPFLRKVGKDPETLAKIEFKVTLPDGETSGAATSASEATKAEKR